MNPLGPIIVTSIICTTVVMIYALSIVRKCVKHFIEKERMEDFPG